jgi:hypothetical protein
MINDTYREKNTGLQCVKEETSVALHDAKTWALRNTELWNVMLEKNADDQ